MTRAEYRPPPEIPVREEVHLIMSRESAEDLYRILSTHHTGEFFQALRRLLYP